MSKPDVTLLLTAWCAGDRAAFDQLLSVTYDELRRLARSHLRRERPGHTLSATGLVHEAWLNLVRQREPAFESRAHFFGAALAPCAGCRRPRRMRLARSVAASASR